MDTGKIPVPKNFGARILLYQAFYKCSKRPPLSWREVVCWLPCLVVNTADHTDTDAVGVVPLNVGADGVFGPAGFDSTVPADHVVVSNVLPALV